VLLSCQLRMISAQSAQTPSLPKQNPAGGQRGLANQHATCSGAIGGSGMPPERAVDLLVAPGVREVR
jgi:hypothetical protein